MKGKVGCLKHKNKIMLLLILSVIIIFISLYTSKDTPDINGETFTDYFNIKAKFGQITNVEKGGFVLNEDKTVICNTNIQIDKGEVIFTISSKNGDVIYKTTANNNSIQETESISIPAGTWYYTLEYVNAMNGDISIVGTEKLDDKHD